MVIVQIHAVLDTVFQRRETCTVNELILVGITARRSRTTGRIKGGDVGKIL